MKTNVIVNMSVGIPITHGKWAVKSYLEQIAKSIAIASLEEIDENVEVTKINAIAQGGIVG